jgi:hypothetical protein
MKIPVSVNIPHKWRVKINDEIRELIKNDKNYKDVIHWIDNDCVNAGYDLLLNKYGYSMSIDPSESRYGIVYTEIEPDFFLKYIHKVTIENEDLMYLKNMLDDNNVKS